MCVANIMAYTSPQHIPCGGVIAIVHVLQQQCRPHGVCNGRFIAFAGPEIKYIFCVHAWVIMCVLCHMHWCLHILYSHVPPILLQSSFCIVVERRQYHTLHLSGRFGYPMLIKTALPKHRQAQPTPMFID